MCRHNRLKGTPSDVAPILWQNGALARLKKGEKIDKLLYGGYSTISLGPDYPHLNTMGVEPFSTSAQKVLTFVYCYYHQDVHLRLLHISLLKCFYTILTPVYSSCRLI